MVKTKVKKLDKAVNVLAHWNSVAKAWTAYCAERWPTPSTDIKAVLVPLERWEQLLWIEDVAKQLDEHGNCINNKEDCQYLSGILEQLSESLDDFHPSENWVNGRAFVYAETGAVEYFLGFESNAELGWCIRSWCHGLRPLSACRPLKYIRDKKSLIKEFKPIWKKFGFDTKVLK